MLLELLNSLQNTHLNMLSPLLFFFMYGIVAGVSHCASLLYGIVLTLSKDRKQHLVEYFLFGRIGSYLIAGALLGLVGSIFELSPVISFLFLLIVTLFVILMGIEMLGLPVFSKLCIPFPTILNKNIVRKSHSSPLWALILGALTFFLPCEFTMTSAGIAASTGDIIRGGLMLLFFVSGTILPLFFVFIAKNKLVLNHRFADLASKVAGLLIVIFAIYNAYHHLIELLIK